MLAIERVLAKSSKLTAGVRASKRKGGAEQVRRKECERQKAVRSNYEEDSPRRHGGHRVVCSTASRRAGIPLLSVLLIR